MENEPIRRAVDGLLAALPATMGPYVVLAACVAAALVLRFVLVRIARRAAGDEGGFEQRALRRTAGLTTLGAVAAGLIAGLSLVELPGAPERDLRHLAAILLVVLIGWTLILLTRLGADMARRHYDISVEDNLGARRSLTQVGILSRTAQIVVVIVSASAVLMTFDGVRHWGVSLLASAGAAGLVIGFAARPVFANLIAGLQIALTQPIRLDDVVIVENEWGWIEEIGSAFVVVRLWDWRRLVVPLSRFIEEPFQNWTRESAAIIGQVTWHLDYAAPVEAMRAKLDELLEASPRWDRRVANLQVTDATERTIVVRALMSARNSPLAWDLRCEIREAMIAWLRAAHPESLPRLRAEVGASPVAPGPAPADAGSG